MLVKDQSQGHNLKGKFTCRSDCNGQLFDCDLDFNRQDTDVDTHQEVNVKGGP